MKSLIFALILFTSSFSLANDDQDGISSCAGALELAQNSCIVYDEYDQEDSYDMDCFKAVLSDYGYSLDDLELENPDDELRPFYNEYLCS
ncbi:MAG: hypothetical protein HRT44_08540 [Bdellovibrionales bacterium]|nr:hypothetical protein [Bdellovibrionales bacterium]NQZ19288.1 hypothetical protein [Bdellovibrionales bacterium]